MICHREPSDWGPTIISNLAYYTLEAELNPGDTMDIGPATPEDSTIAAFLFVNYAEFTVRGRRAGLLLCVGITPEELDACREHGSDHVVSRLMDAGVYPFTDLRRSSVI